mgnify:FL=1
MPSVGANSPAREIDAADIELALTEWLDLPNLTAKEELVVATHEAGHAVCAMFSKHSSPIERISIRGDLAGALGYVQSQEHAHKYVITRDRLLDDMCMAMGGRAAEELLPDDLSIGSEGDLIQATHIARMLVEECGRGGDDVTLFNAIDQFKQSRHFDRWPQLSEEHRAALDRRINELIREARQRAGDILRENRDVLVALRDLLLEKKVIDAKGLAQFKPTSS